MAEFILNEWCQKLPPVKSVYVFLVQREAIPHSHRMAASEPFPVLLPRLLGYGLDLKQLQIIQGACRLWWRGRVTSLDGG